MAFKTRERVQAHPATDVWMRGDRYGTVEMVGRKYVHVKMDRSGRTLKFTEDNLIKVAPTLPAHAVGKKCFYIALDGRKVAAVVESIDNERHPARYNLRVTATKDRTYRRGKLINTPPAFVLAR